MTCNKFKIILISFCLVFVSACSDFLKGKPKTEEVLEVKQESMSCLKDVSLQVSKFLKSEMTTQDLDKTFNCFDQTLAEFQNKVEGKEAADAFNSDELFQIFDRFIKDANITKAAVNELLVLKEAILGGTSQRITKLEISQLRDLLKVVRSEMQSLIPFAKVLTFQKSSEKFPKAMIQDAFAQLNMSLKKLMHSSKIMQSNYALDDLKRLIVNLNVLSPGSEKYFSLIDKVNNLIRGTQDVVSKADRELYIDNMTAAIKIYAIQQQGYLELKMNSPEALANSMDSIAEIIKFLESTLQFKKSNLISVDTIDPVITCIHDAHAFPLNIRLETALSFYKTLMVRVFQSGLHSDAQSFKGLERAHFVNVKKELAIYQIYSEFLAKVAWIPNNPRNDKNRTSLQKLRESIRAFDPASQQKVLKDFTTEQQNLIIKAVKEFGAEAFKNPAAIYRYDRLIIANNQEIWFQNWHDLMKGLQFMMLSRLMIIGWGEVSFNKEMKTSYMSEQGMVQWYSEFKDFGVETKAFDPRIENMGINTLKAANLFTKSAQTDNKMDFTEAIEQLSILVTGGAHIPEQMVLGFQKANCQLAETDVFNNSWNNESCVIENLYRNYKWYFLNMPYLVRFIDGLSRAQFGEFYKTLMEVARTKPENAGIRLETSDVRTMVTLLHYIESLFAVYDKNSNMQLTVAEIKSSYYPRFVEASTAYAHKTAQAQLDKFKKIPGYGCYSEEDLIRESFVFLVINQREPKQSDFNLFPCTPIFKRPLIDLKGTVDRKGIINTFKILKDVLGS